MNIHLGGAAPGPPVLPHVYAQFGDDRSGQRISYQQLSNSKGGPRSARGPIAVWARNNRCQAPNAAARHLH